MTEYQSPQKLPATTNEIRAALTSSLSSPESPETKYSHYKTPEINNNAGDHSEANSPTTIPHTRRIKRALTCELDNVVQPNHPKNSSNTDSQTQHTEPQRQDLDADWIYTYQQLNEIAITKPTTSEQCIPILSAINLKRKKKMLFAPMDFNNLFMDALIDLGPLYSQRDGPTNIQTTGRKWRHRSTHQDCPTTV